MNMAAKNITIYDAPDGGTGCRIDGWEIVAWSDAAGISHYQAMRPNGQPYSQWERRAATVSEIETYNDVYTSIRSAS